MKILIITLTISEKCGLGRYSLDLIEELAKNNELTIYTSKEDKKLNLSFPNSKMFYPFPGESKIYRIMRPWLFFKYLFVILPQARQADLIHSMMDFPYSFLAVVIGRLTKKPVVATAHGTYSIIPFFNRRWAGLLKWTDRNLNRIICVSNFTKKEILKQLDLKNCEAIDNGINLEKFSESGSTAESGKKTKMILSVGMLKLRKGFHVSLEAVALVKEKWPDLKYYIVGRQDDKNYFERLKKIVKDKNLGNTVVFFENISDRELKKLYCQADLFLLTPVYIEGNFEGFGLVYLEAGVLGKPVVGSWGSGSEDAVIDGKTGFLVAQNDEGAAAEAILKILDNSDLAHKLGENGKNFAQEHDWEKVARKYQEVYENIIKN